MVYTISPRQPAEVIGKLGRAAGVDLSISLVSIIVINLNGKHLLADCLNSLRSQSYPRVETILVDNNSIDGSTHYVRDHFPEVKIISNSFNAGFAVGCNQGIAKASGQLIATLNNDTTVEPRWLEDLVLAIEKDESFGMAASKMLFSTRPRMINSAGIAIDRLGIAWDRFGGMDDSSPESNVETEIFGPCAGAALYRRSMLDDVGVFDEQFFMFLEDVDLAWRAQARGWRCVYVPTARVYHVHSATAGNDSPFKRFHLARNKVWLLAKNFEWPRLLYYLPLLMIYEIASASYGAFKDRDLTSLSGRLKALSNLGNIMRKRREIQSRRTVDFKRMSHLFAPIPSPMQVTARYRHLRRTLAT